MWANERTHSIPPWDGAEPHGRPPAGVRAGGVSRQTRPPSYRNQLYLPSGTDWTRLSIMCPGSLDLEFDGRDTPALLLQSLPRRLQSLAADGASRSRRRPALRPPRLSHARRCAAGSGTSARIGGWANGMPRSRGLRVAAFTCSAKRPQELQRVRLSSAHPWSSGPGSQPWASSDSRPAIGHSENKDGISNPGRWAFHISATVHQVGARPVRDG